MYRSLRRRLGRGLGEALLLDFRQDLDGLEVLAEDAGLDAGVIFEGLVDDKREREGVAGQLEIGRAHV